MFCSISQKDWCKGPAVANTREGSINSLIVFCLSDGTALLDDYSDKFPLFVSGKTC